MLTEEQVRLRKQEETRRLRAKVLELLGGKCVDCGTTDERVLQVDHINGAPEPKHHGQRSGNGLYRAIVRGEKPLSEFQLLCANCNQIKKQEQGEHGNYKQRRGIVP